MPVHRHATPLIYENKSTTTLKRFVRTVISPNQFTTSYEGNEQNPSWEQFQSQPSKEDYVLNNDRSIIRVRITLRDIREYNKGHLAGV